MSILSFFLLHWQCAFVWENYIFLILSSSRLVSSRPRPIFAYKFGQMSAFEDVTQTEPICEIPSFCWKVTKFEFGSGLDSLYEIWTRVGVHERWKDYPRHRLKNCHNFDFVSNEVLSYIEVCQKMTDRFKVKPLAKPKNWS